MPTIQDSASSELNIIPMSSTTATPSEISSHDRASEMSESCPCPVPLVPVRKSNRERHPPIRYCEQIF